MASAPLVLRFLRLPHWPIRCMHLPSLLRPLALGTGLLATLGLGACTTVSVAMSNAISGVITPYKVEIVQGNVVTSEQVDRIKPGRSRSDVREVLGSPLLADPFHGDRWDYVFTLKRRGTEPQQRSVVVLFEGDLVKSVLVPPDLPSERDFVASITRQISSRSGTEPKLALTDAERAALPQPQPAPSSTRSTAPEGPVRSYPSLETL